MTNNIMVSICCNAFNHKEYIAETLDSLLSQKTNFKFEIIVHDDASIDGTQNIIEKYAKRYPDIIYPILEKENQYSKGVDVTKDITVLPMKGKYLAFCEGDDFWTDDNKLQKQVDIMESDDKISMCCHAHRRIKAKNKKQINICRATIEQDGFIGKEDCLSSSNFPHLTSMLVRLNDYINMPKIFEKLPIGDYPLRAYMLSLGKVYYIDEVMSSYRVMSPSSWSKKFQFNMEYRYNTNKKMDEFLLRYDEYTNYIYHDYINGLIEEKDFNTAIFTGHYDEAMQSPIYEKAGGGKKLLIKIGLKNPKLAMKLGNLYSAIKNKIKP